MNLPTTYPASQNEFTLKEKIQYSLLGILVIGGSFYLGRKLVRGTIATAEEKKTFEQGNPAMYAQQIKMAFENDGWWGTNTDALRQAMQSVPSIAEFKKVINSYQKLYNSSLMMDMKKALKSSEYNEMLAILAAKPQSGSTAIAIQLTVAQYQSWAQRLKAAFDITYGIFPGTDEKAIMAVFREIPSQDAFAQLGLVYKNMYGNALDQDLKSELEFWEYPTYMKVITDKPQS